jgi:glycosyltransferase involved in cell wall biosynthesis
MIKVYLDGAKHLQGQVNRIGEGFIELGHELTDFISDADLIYSNNPSPTRTQLVKDKADGKLKPGAKLIFTVLDYPLHLEGFQSFQQEIPLIKADLAAADAICSISEYTQRMVKEKYGFDSEVIYNPQKHTKNLNSFPRRYLGCIVGRKTDPNKNVAAVISALQTMGISEDWILMVGEENIGWGNYQGVINDENLNRVYNSCLLSFSCGIVEGLNLPAIEAASVGCIPVIHSQLTTREELFPSKFFPEYNTITNDPASIVDFIVKMLDNGRAGKFIDLLTTHYKGNLEKKFDKVNVARRIVDIYSKL